MTRPKQLLIFKCRRGKFWDNLPFDFIINVGTAVNADYRMAAGDTEPGTQYLKLSELPFPSRHPLLGNLKTRSPTAN